MRNLKKGSSEMRIEATKIPLSGNRNKLWMPREKTWDMEA